MDVKAYIKEWQESYKNDFVNNIMPFWLKYGLDKENGGVYTCLDKEGNIEYLMYLKKLILLSKNNQSYLISLLYLKKQHIPL